MNGTANRFYCGAIYRMACEGAVEIDNVQPFEPEICKAPRG